MTWYVHDGMPYTGDRIAPDDVEISDRPSHHHTWIDNAWVSQPWYDWAGLKDSLRATDLFSVAMGTSNQNAFALLLSTFDSSSSNESKLQDFVWAVGAVRAGLATDYTEAQLQTFRDQLTEYGFPVFL